MLLRKRQGGQQKKPQNAEQNRIPVQYGRQPYVGQNRSDNKHGQGRVAVSHIADRFGNDAGQRKLSHHAEQP